MLERVVAIVKEIFLPIGYPSSVADDYAEYQFWDSIQAIASSLMMAISLVSAFEGYGVGSATATAYTSTFTWLFKDGIGLVSRILIAWYIGSNLNVKLWRFLADVCNDLSFFIEFTVCRLTQNNTAIMAAFAVASSFRALVGVVGGTTRALVAIHQANCDNVADVIAKDNSQEVLVNLCSMAFNMLLISLIQAKPGLAWMMLCSCSALHLYCNYKLVRSLRLRTLNFARLRLAMIRYFNAHIVSRESGLAFQPALDLTTINREESILLTRLLMRGRYSVKIGEQCSVDLMNASARDDVDFKLRDGNTATGFLDGNTYHIVLCNNYRPADLFREGARAACMGITKEIMDNEMNVMSFFIASNADACQQYIDAIFDELYPDIVDRLKSNNWDVTKLDAPIGSHRYLLNKKKS